MKLNLLTGALAALAVAPALAAAGPSDQDKAFVQQAAAGGMAEVQEGQLAAQKASAGKVRQFGQQMVHDHTQNNEALQKLAAAKGITPPGELDPAHAQEVASLKNASGAAFDPAYITDQVSGHQKMAAVMQAEIQGGSDPDLKAFARQTLPVVQHHLMMAEQLQGSSGGAGLEPIPAQTDAQLATAADRSPSGTLEKYHGMLRGTELDGATVYNDQGNSIGTINDLLVAGNGTVENAVISVGGFLGIGTHYVSVPFGQLQISPSRQPAMIAGSTGNGAIGAGAASGTVAGADPAGTTGSAPATMTASNDPAGSRQYFSVVLPGATKDSLTRMPEFRYRG